MANIAYEFHFTTHVLDGKTFLYNTGPISSIYDRHFNRRQTYSVALLKGSEAITEAANGFNKKPDSKVIGNNLACPPCNIGPSSTPNYPALAAEAVHSLPGGIKVFAGQRNDGFFADLGAVFDLADLRPFQNLHLSSMVAAASGIDTLKSGTNVHTIAMQIPISKLTRDGSVPKNVDGRGFHDRNLGRGESAQDAGARRRQSARARSRAPGCRSRGWPIRCSTSCWSR